MPVLAHKVRCVHSISGNPELPSRWQPIRPARCTGCIVHLPFHLAFQPTACKMARAECSFRRRWFGLSIGRISFASPSVFPLAGCPRPRDRFLSRKKRSRPERPSDADQKKAHLGCACRGRSSPRMETKPIMKRVLVVTLLSLGAAGCAQSRSALSQQDPPGSTAARSKLGPVAVNPVPSLDETVNRGFGNSAVVRSAIKDPDNPRWSGRAPATSVAPSPGGAVPAGPGQSQTQMALTDDGKPTRLDRDRGHVPAWRKVPTQLPATAAVPEQGPLATQLPATAAVPAPGPLATELPATAAVPAAGPFATEVPAAAPSSAPPETTARGVGSALPLSGPDAAAAIAATPAQNPAPASQPDALTNPVSLPAPDSPRETLTMPTPISSPPPESTPAPGAAVPSEPPGTSMGLPVSGPIPVPPEGPQTGVPALPAGPQNAMANPPPARTPGPADATARWRARRTGQPVQPASARFT